eukprot:1161833-Pelagomonas_calceolata.AAC.2
MDHASSGWPSGPQKYGQLMGSYDTCPWRTTETSTERHISFSSVLNDHPALPFPHFVPLWQTS